MKIALIPLLLLLTFAGELFGQKAPVAKKHGAFTIGQTIELKSAILKENRLINIYLPQDYSPDSARTYPVIYLLDGSKDEDFIHITGLTQFHSFSWINNMPEAIIIGIANVDRKRDFTYPTSVEADKKEFPTTGGSEAFIKFLDKELQTYVAKNYRGNGQRTIIGQSLGGLLATEILLKHPELFDNYLIVSPSLWWDNQSLLAIKGKDFNKPKRVFVAVGKEGREMESVAKKLHKNLQKWSDKGLTVTFKFLKELDHGDTLHLAAYYGLKWLFKP